CPPRRSRRTIFAPILPRPIMPIFITTPLLSCDLLRLRSWLVETPPQPIHRQSHFLVFSKHRCSGDQHIGFRFYHGASLMFAWSMTALRIGCLVDTLNEFIQHGVELSIGLLGR